MGSDIWNYIDTSYPAINEKPISTEDNDGIALVFLIFGEYYYMYF